MMTAAKKILCPVDFSDVACNGLEYAARIAEKIGGAITLCHVQPSVWPETVFLGDEVYESDQAIQFRLGQMCKETSDTFHVHCDYLNARTTDTVEGSIASISGAYDLIIMGTNGTEDFFEFIFGSHSFNVSRLAQCPVMVIPEGCPLELPEFIVYLHKQKINPRFDFLVPIWWSQILGARFGIWLESTGESASDQQLLQLVTSQMIGERPEGLIDFIRIHQEPEPGVLVPRYMFALALHHRALNGRKTLRRIINTCQSPMLVFEIPD